MNIWNGIKRILKELWSAIADRQWNLDPYKVGGFACFGVAGILAFRIFDLVFKVDAGTLGILSGLVSAIIGVGMFLFNQARKSDDTLK